jgi:hypothetical protein
MRVISRATLVSAVLIISAHSQSTDANVKLAIHTRGDQSTFRIGEVIPLELSFSSTTPDKYRIDMASYDRSGRLNADRFLVEPSSGWDDPLNLYIRSYGVWFGGGQGYRRVIQ